MIQTVLKTFMGFETKEYLLDIDVKEIVLIFNEAMIV